MDINLFDYNLPKERISQNPCEKRENARLLVINKGKIEHKHFYDLVDYLSSGDVVVVNDTKVSPCKIEGRKSSGADVEVVIEEKIDERNNFRCRVKGRTRKGDFLLFEKGLKGTVIERGGEFSYIHFNKKVSGMKITYPYYVKNKNIDSEYYQTVFCGKEGSLAAPTAGLHFSKDLIKKIERKGVKIAKISLNIGFGTFAMIHDLEHHKLAKEYIEISKKSADIINNRKGRLFCVGTTTIKALETASYGNKVVPFKGYSDLFIKPGYKFHVNVDGMITNFHMPKSSLLLLVSAFYDRQKLLDAYKMAVDHEYRFLSFGDAMLIIK